METIFTYNPTKAELNELTADKSISEENYLKAIQERANSRGSKLEYELLVDIEQLFAIRGDISKAKEYSERIANEFSDLRDILFNE